MIASNVWLRHSTFEWSSLRIQLNVGPLRATADDPRQVITNAAAVWKPLKSGFAKWPAQTVTIVTINIHIS